MLNNFKFNWSGNYLGPFRKKTNMDVLVETNQDNLGPLPIGTIYYTDSWNYVKDHPKVNVSFFGKIEISINHVNKKYTFQIGDYRCYNDGMYVGQIKSNVPPNTFPYTTFDYVLFYLENIKILK